MAAGVKILSCLEQKEIGNYLDTKHAEVMFAVIFLIMWAEQFANTNVYVYLSC